MIYINNLFPPIPLMNSFNFSLDSKILYNFERAIKNYCSNCLSRTLENKSLEINLKYQTKKSSVATPPSPLVHLVAGVCAGQALDKIFAQSYCRLPVAAGWKLHLLGICSRNRTLVRGGWHGGRIQQWDQRYGSKESSQMIHCGR